MCMLVFSSASDYIDMAFSIMYAWRHELPWLIIGMCHPDLNAARRLGRKALDKLVAMANPQVKNCHHRITWTWLGYQSALRGFLVEFVESSILEKVRSFNIERLFLRLVSLTGRPGESEHVHLHVSATKRGYPPSCSLLSRSPVPLFQGAPEQRAGVRQISVGILQPALAFVRGCEGPRLPGASNIPKYIAGVWQEAQEQPLQPHNQS